MTGGEEREEVKRGEEGRGEGIEEERIREGDMLSGINNSRKRRKRSLTADSGGIGSPAGAGTVGSCSRSQ